MVGSPPRPKMKFCQGTSVLRHGTPLASHWSATGFTWSAVEVTSMRSTFSLLIRSPATAAAREVSDWPSLAMNLMGCVAPSLQDQSARDCFGGALQTVLVGHAECGEHPGLRRHKAHLELATCRRRGAHGRRACRGGRAW